MGFEPTRGDPIGLAGRRLSRSAKVSLVHWWPNDCNRKMIKASEDIDQGQNFKVLMPTAGAQQLANQKVIARTSKARALMI